MDATQDDSRRVRTVPLSVSTPPWQASPLSTKNPSTTPIYEDTAHYILCEMIDLAYRSV